jgi:hypothetical protein
MAKSLGEQETTPLTQGWLDEGSQLDPQLIQCAQDEVIPALEAMDEDDGEEAGMGSGMGNDPSMHGQRGGRSSYGGSTRSGGRPSNAQRKK